LGDRGLYQKGKLRAIWWILETSRKKKRAERKGKKKKRKEKMLWILLWIQI
jgi:hypothetical protein